IVLCGGCEEERENRPDNNNSQRHTHSVAFLYPFFEAAMFTHKPPLLVFFV
ncbi:hypothetical protein GQ42DRAFT_162547, partial [Ramicandelaber brevisporus]